MNIVVTTVQNPTGDVEKLARQIAASLNMPFVARSKNSLAAIKEWHGVSDLLVVTTKGPVAHTPGGEFFFHLNMSELRIKNLINGKHDHMVAAMDLKPGMTVLDCTLGLATDAIVASFIVGNDGKVRGVESSPLIAVITQYGLQNFTCDDEYINRALRNIRVENMDYYQYLVALSSASFDVVYFDPMFRQPIYSSSNLKPLRYLADSRPLSKEIIREACRVAKKRVVVKEGRDSKEFERLGITIMAGGKYSSIRYGIINIDDRPNAGGCLWNVL